MSSSRRAPNFYDVLGIDKSSSADEVRKAYRKKALETHPDKLDPTATDEEKQAAERDFHKIHEAFQTIGDPQKKRRYDAVLALRLDHKLVSKESARLMADRHEWARQQEEQSKRRMEAFRAKLENTPVVPHSAPATVVKHQQPRAQPTTRKEKEVKQVKQIFDDLMSAHPEFAARRRVALQRKAENELADREKLQALSETPLTA